MKNEITSLNNQLDECCHATQPQVVLIRHAQSEWNRQNRFTGWADPPLTDTGVIEAVQAGDLLMAKGFDFNVAYSSRLQRAVNTLDILLTRLDKTHMPRAQDWRLNERHYGVLQGVNKTEAMQQAGEHQVWRWRRGYEDRAEPVLRTNPTHPAHDPLYADIEPHMLPGVENLAQTRQRVMEFWREQVAPRIKNGERVLISAHGNTLRALLMDLAGMTIAQVESFEIPTATPILCDFDRNGQLTNWQYLEKNYQAARFA